MKEIVLSEDMESKKVASISHTSVLISQYDKGSHGSLYLVDDCFISKEDIKKIYHAIEEEG